MTHPVSVDAALCLLAGLIAKQLPDPALLASDLKRAAGNFTDNQDLSSLLKRLALAVEDGSQQQRNH